MRVPCQGNARPSQNPGHRRGWSLPPHLMACHPREPKWLRSSGIDRLRRTWAVKRSTNYKRELSCRHDGGSHIKQQSRVRRRGLSQREVGSKKKEHYRRKVGLRLRVLIREKRRCERTIALAAEGTNKTNWPRERVVRCFSLLSSAMMAISHQPQQQRT